MECFLIVSVIKTVDKPLSYSTKRSVYSVEERILQTENTISSIRKKLPNAYIIMFEVGLRDVRNIFETQVDEYYYQSDVLIRFAVDSKFKGLGESISISRALSLIDKTRFDRVIKISGRYILDKSFNLESFKSDKFSFLVREHNTTKSLGPIKINDIKSYATVLYSIPTVRFLQFKFIIFCAVPLLILNVSIESALYILIPKKTVNILNRLGVSGEISVSGEKLVL